MFGGQQTSGVYQFCVCSGNSLVRHGQAPFPNSTDVIGYWKRGSDPAGRFIAPDYGNSANGVIIYDPFGEVVTANITDAVSQPVGATISQKGSL
jgi:hypothetical protein